MRMKNSWIVVRCQPLFKIYSKFKKNVPYKYWQEYILTNTTKTKGGEKVKLKSIIIYLLCFVFILSANLGFSNEQASNNPKKMPGYSDRNKSKPAIWIKNVENQAGKEGQMLFNSFMQVLESASENMTVIRPTSDTQRPSAKSIDRKVHVSIKMEGKKIRAHLSVMNIADKKIKAKDFKFIVKKASKGANEMAGFVVKHSGVDIKTKDIKVTTSVKPLKSINISIWLDRPKGVYRSGESMTIYYQAKHDCYLSLFQFNDNSQVTRVFPSEQNSFNFLEGGRIYSLNTPAGNKSGQYSIKAVATMDPSNAGMPGVKFKGGPFNIGPMRVIPTSDPVIFADWELSRFIYLPTDRFDEDNRNYFVQP